MRFQPRPHCAGTYFPFRNVGAARNTRGALSDADTALFAPTITTCALPFAFSGRRPPRAAFAARLGRVPRRPPASIHGRHRRCSVPTGSGRHEVRYASTQSANDRDDLQGTLREATLRDVMPMTALQRVTTGYHIDAHEPAWSRG